jgi:divalent metal cation (Fe/Co/Zn/Cd) transporter
VEAVIKDHPEFKSIERLQMRWLGHQFRCEVSLLVDAGLPLSTAYKHVEHLRHHLKHELPNLGDVTVQLVPE